MSIPTNWTTKTTRNPHTGEVATRNIIAGETGFRKGKVIHELQIHVSGFLKPEKREQVTKLISDLPNALFIKPLKWLRYQGPVNNIIACAESLDREYRIYCTVHEEKYFHLHSRSHRLFSSVDEAIEDCNKHYLQHVADCLSHLTTRGNKILSEF